MKWSREGFFELFLLFLWLLDTFDYSENRKFIDLITTCKQILYSR